MRKNECPWAESADVVLRNLGSSPNGLEPDRAALLLDEHGHNRLPEVRRAGPLTRLARQFNNLLILVLIAAAIITGLLGHWIDTGVILAVVAINALIGYVQEGRAEAALDCLRNMLAPRANVIRAGERMAIPGTELVPGDIVVLEAGDKVPADLRLIDVAGLRVEEAMLTGESVPVRKVSQPVEADASLGDRRAMAFSGTMVTEGTGLGVVTATGQETEIGRISTMMAEVQAIKTPLITQMEVFARYLTGFVLAVATGILGFTVVLRETPFAEAFMIVVGLFVAAIPEGLPAVLTVTLAIGVQSMARRNAIVRRLPIIETLGAVSTICSDKTGTLTRNEMMLASAVTFGGTARVAGRGYAPEGAVEGGNRAALDAMAQVSALCNSAALVRDDKGWRVEGDPMEGALLAFAGKLGVPVADRASADSTIPFDARYRYMAVLHDGVVRLKGAPEQVISHCNTQMGPDGPEPLDRAFWDRAGADIAAQGQRVLALAQMPYTGADLNHDTLAHGLTLLGLVGLIDPPRDEAIAAVAECHEAGISVKMITGDHAGTAAAIGRQIGLRLTDHPLTGAEIDQMDDAALEAAIRRTDIFARTSPEHKLRLVQALQARGQVVAMTGDGVNDAPALKRADAGIAMGLKGSEAAREAADFVLADDNFASIAEAVKQGRTVYANLKKVITFLLPVNGGESISLIIAILFGLLLPISPLQILWVNMISSVALAMSLAFERPEATIMNQPPRRADAPILSRFILWRVLIVSVLFAIGIFGQFALAQAQGAGLDEARTMAVNTLVAMEVFYLFSVRYRHGWSLTWQGVKGTPAVLVAVALVAALQAIFTYLPVMQSLFGTVALAPWQLAQCAAAGVLLMVLLEFDKHAARGWKRLSSASP
ncbi:HAD-IC family P-type ATPase [Lutimaribacter sp. EGI FJ00015]|uniref:HAD-IC family P-type ATPase n=1 Tax=Lutimaribacter degradans TaxID=2945989 RepID=A0ACC5ZZT2_9RHOB|nr:HAD-IC family P-type ATPase [Lutimaribacter sp. EGI FJ00013]MCM2563610.1 HAD-IC family P-type ATPase [Lutimaribacter sp. EGI FJ00013]MCO0614725.1 HAD-IC family P-type ATPase [Lutimaribacter sp. EGI FJ00015]MCO0637395.1 HAD-IC family P-type ATPase [Lutimaribacter sp. EGI FJ00014]